ncbi:hypothetical protein KAR48_06615 [bacterium]|nr:hypothetical protein [bacterium]
MNLLTTVISICYYVFIAYVAILMIINLIRSRKWEQELLYVIVLLPFLLRLFRLK